MEVNELKAFAEFLKLQENQSKSDYLNSFKEKALSSISLFILSIIGFKISGQILL